MRNRSATTRTLCAALSLLVAGCGSSDETNASDPVAVNESAIATTGDSSPATATPTTAPVTTTTVDPTVFNPQRIGRLAELASFVFTIDELHVSTGGTSTRRTTIGYIKEPFDAYVVADLGGGDVVQEYLVGGRYYERDHQNYWTMYEDGSLGTPDLLYVLQTEYALSSVLTATFVGEEAFEGTPAYHFTFDETNLANFDYFTPENPGPEAEGDFYLAKDGNYPLYVHSRSVLSGPGFELIDEYTETATEVNQVAPITLPANMQPLKDAFDMGLTFGIPMPADATLDSMINYNSGGIGVYYYQYTSSWKNEAEFIAFYTDLPPTNGWEVTHIGQVKNLDAYCIDGNCVMIKNGDMQFILYFDGSNLHADYDREHRFVAQ